MLKDNKILIGKNKNAQANILLNMANRHGLITGASGSGKTITLKVMAESFSDAGVPVFFSDVKGDLAGCVLEGENNESIAKRLENLDIKDFEFKSYPVRFWDLFREFGHPIRTTVSSIGPDILSIMLGLSEAQEGNLDIVFKIAEDENRNLDDLKDLKIFLQYVADNKNDYITKYGNITSQSIGVIQRSLLSLENQGLDKFFGLPSLDINDLISINSDGRGVINILNAVKLFNSPDLYASFMLWLLIELYTKMPEVGDLDKPKIVFFFDEAHLLFNEMPGYRLKRITQIVKLIRSRGIGLYFVSQKPTDIPNHIIAQLGNRVQHTLRAYTPAELKVVKTAADAFRENPKFNTEKTILELGTGEALVSFQNEQGEPEIVQKVTILPPQSKIGTIDTSTYNRVINSSIYAGKYDKDEDRYSAYEEVSKINEEKKIKEEELKKIKEEEKLAKEKERQKSKEEREKRNSTQSKIKRKIFNKTTDKLLNRILNAIIKKIFK